MKSQAIFYQLFEHESSTYTYIIADPASKEAAIIDPVLTTVDRDLNLIEELGLKLKFVIDTHIHADHITGAGEIRRRTAAKSVVSVTAQVSCVDIALKEVGTWPDLKIGPSFKEIKENNTRVSLTGVSLSMPLPIFSWNLDGRAFGSEKLAEARLNFDAARTKAKSTRLVLESRYKSYVSNLQSILNSKVVSDKHKEVENLFFKGVISGPLVIEAHRQLFDLEQKRNESEFGAIESLGHILIYDNQFNEVIL